MYVTLSPGDTVNNAYMGLKISLEMITYHSRNRPPASWPSSSVNRNRSQDRKQKLKIVCCFAYLRKRCRSDSSSLRNFDDTFRGTSPRTQSHDAHERLIPHDECPRPFDPVRCGNSDVSHRNPIFLYGRPVQQMVHPTDEWSIVARFDSELSGAFRQIARISIDRALEWPLKLVTMSCDQRLVMLPDMPLV